jgi:putative hydrolase of the HAD superfamily
MFLLIAFDADDTLWHNESTYTALKERFIARLAPFAAPEAAAAALDRREIENLASFGYGMKAFTLSMIETAITLSDGRIPATEFQGILADTRRALSTPVQLLPNAAECVAALAQNFRLLIITKGDPIEQEAKARRSGLEHHFIAVEVLTDKNPERYAALLSRYQVTPPQFLMVGNSLRSDIFPVCQLGGQAVYIPYEQTWAHENEIAEGAHCGEYVTLEHLGLLPAWVAAQA